jgi:cell division septal protein FtsQ
MESVGRRRAKKRRRVKKRFIAFLILLLAGVLIALSLTVLFPIREIAVGGVSPYSQEEIRTAAGVSVGENILLADAGKIAASVESQLPMIGEAVVTKKFFSGLLSVEVQEMPSVYAYEIGGEYWLANEKGKIVEKLDYTPADLCVVAGTTAASPAIGQPYVIENEDARRIFTELTAVAAAKNLRVTRIELDDLSDICFVLDGRLYVKLGSSADLTYKISHAAATAQDMEADAEGTLDLTWWTASKKEAYFRRGDIEKIVSASSVVSGSADDAGDDASSDTGSEVSSGASASSARTESEKSSGSSSASGGQSSEN